MQIVGRDAEIAEIDSALAAMAAGERQLLIVHGEAGIGKTRLLGYIADRARDRRWEPLIGRATELESAVPFGLFRDAIPLLSARSARSARAARSARDADGRWDAFRIVTEQCEPRARLVLLLDDFHWADPASQELVEELVRRPPRLPQLIVIAGRPGPAIDTIRAAVRSVGRGFAEVPLRPLSRSASCELMGSQWSEDDRNRMFETSGGNPLYLEELAKADTSGQIPGSLIAMVSLDLERLSEEGQALVRAGAVVGDPFDIDVARRIAGLDFGAALKAADRLVDGGFVRGTPVLREFAFRHPVIRSAVYQSLSPSGRLAGHARAAAVLAEMNAPWTSRARHLALTAGPGDADAAAVLREAAGLIRAQAPSIAADWLQAARRVAAADDPALDTALAECLVQAGRLDEALAIVDEHTASDRWAGEHRIRVIVVAAAAERLLGRHDASYRRLTRGLEESVGPTEKAEMMAAMALAAYELGDDEGMARWSAAARTEGAADVLVSGVVAAILAIGYRFAGRIDESTLEADFAVAAVRRATAHELSARAELVVAIPWALVAVERFADALEVARRAAAAARQADNLVGAVPLGIAEVLALGLAGRIDEAVIAADQTERAARLTHNDQSLQWALWMRAYFVIESGDLEAARTAAVESVALAERLDRSALVTIGNAVLGAVLLAEGKAAEALPLLSAYDVEPGWIARWAPRVVEAHIALADLDSAQTAVDRAVAMSRESGLNGARAAADRAGSTLALAKGDLAAALTLANSSVERAHELGSSIDEAQGRILVARASTDRDEAIRQLISARDLASGGGARRVADEAIRELRKLGHRTGRGGTRGVGRTGLPSLSGREREIADLVALGLTNREIAARLFLSDKTIESHLAKAFAKLGVSSRAALAAQVSAG